MEEEVDPSPVLKKAKALEAKGLWDQNARLRGRVEELEKESAYFKASASESARLLDYAKARVEELEKVKVQLKGWDELMNKNTKLEARVEELEKEICGLMHVVEYTKENAVAMLRIFEENATPGVNMLVYSQIMNYFVQMLGGN